MALVPVYYHNYVLGYLTAVQLGAHLEKNVSGRSFFISELSGTYLLRSFFRPGAYDNMEDTIFRATRKPLNPDYFVKSL